MIGCEHVQSSLVVIHEVSAGCLRKVEWLDGKYFCLRQDCRNCQLGNSIKQRDDDKRADVG